jgi:hypothetical protein
VAGPDADVDDGWWSAGLACGGAGRVRRRAGMRSRFDVELCRARHGHGGARHGVEESGRRRRPHHRVSAWSEQRRTSWGIGLIEGWVVDGQAPAGGRAQPGGTPTVIDLGEREKRASGGGVGHRHTAEIKSPYFYRSASNRRKLNNFHQFYLLLVVEEPLIETLHGVDFPKIINI